MSQLSLRNQAPKIDALALSLEQLQQTLSAEDAEREREWAEVIGQALVRLEAALRQHRSASRRPDGPLAEVDETRPTLARQADDLRSDYDDFLWQLLSLREQIRHAAEGFAPSSGVTTGGMMDVCTIRQQAEHILTGLQEDRAEEMKLVLESVNTDIGTGD